MVALSPKTVQELFPDLKLSKQELGKAYLEMSGRKGIGVRADDLLDTLQERARKEVRTRDPDASDKTTEERARRIAVGALRYYMLRFSKNRVVAFDLEAALAFEGETGPYLQYAVLRARNILAKVSGADGESFVEATTLAKTLRLNALPAGMLADHWQLATLVARTPTILRQSIDSLELSLAAKHAYLLAQTFNSFYHRYKVATEKDPEIKKVRTAFVRLFHDGLTALLDQMGIDIPDRM
jgi:arginyl-tRNA synthetase